MTVELSLIAPCLNEEENVQELARRFMKAGRDYGRSVEIIFVDDGSTDSTKRKVELLERDTAGVVRLVVHPTNLGIAESWSSGLASARGEFICLIDSDLQNPPELAFELLHALEDSGADLAQGVRIPSQTQQRRRVLISRMLNYVLNLSFGMKARDNKSGFIVTRREHMQNILTRTGSYRHFQTFVRVAASAKGLKVIEIDTPFEDRRAGVSFLSGRTFRVTLQVLGDIRKARREYLV